MYVANTLSGGNESSPSHLNRVLNYDEKTYLVV